MSRMSQRCLVAVVVGVLCAGSALAQTGGNRTQSFQFRVGGTFLEGGGDLWVENEDVFTMNVSDFDSAIFGVSFVRAINNNIEMGINADYYDESVLSAYRGWVDESGFPIYHDTTLSSLPLTVDLRVLPFGRYRTGGRGQVMQPVVYLGGGIGVNFWEYEEVGDFLDFSMVVPEIFFDRFVDDGAAFEYHAVAGVELPVNPAVNLILEGRYIWSDGELDGDFAGLGSIVFDGFSVTVGASFRY
jgi:hypothetical protein